MTKQTAELDKNTFEHISRIVRDSMKSNINNIPVETLKIAVRRWQDSGVFGTRTLVAKKKVEKLYEKA